MTNALRGLVDAKLNTLKETYQIKDIGYRVASDQKMYPHIVWFIDNVAPTDMGRHDYTITFHVWGRQESDVFDIMDGIVELLAFDNDPNEEILPTFYDVSRGTIDDPDKTLVHGVVRCSCQVYASNVTDNNILHLYIS